MGSDRRDGSVGVEITEAELPGWLKHEADWFLTERDQMNEAYADGEG